MSRRSCFDRTLSEAVRPSLGTYDEREQRAEGHRAVGANAVRHELVAIVLVHWPQAPLD